MSEVNEDELLSDFPSDHSEESHHYQMCTKNECILLVVCFTSLFISFIISFYVEFCYIAKADQIFDDLILSRESNSSIIIIVLTFLFFFFACLVCLGCYKYQKNPKSNVCCASYTFLIFLFMVIFYIAMIVWCLGILINVAPSKYESYYKSTYKYIRDSSLNPEFYQWLFGQFNFTPEEADQNMTSRALKELIKTECEKCDRFKLRILELVFKSPMIVLIIYTIYDMLAPKNDEKDDPKPIEDTEENDEKDDPKILENS